MRRRTKKTEASKNSNEAAVTPEPTGEPSSENDLLGAEPDPEIAAPYASPGLKFELDSIWHATMKRVSLRVFNKREGRSQRTIQTQVKSLLYAHYSFCMTLDYFGPKRCN